MTDAIRPPTARAPECLSRLVADAVGDGDLDAALTYYEPHAVVCLPGAPPARGTAQITRILRRVIDAKLAIEVRLRRVHTVGSLALLSGRWVALGATDAIPTCRAGPVRSVARRGPEGAWRIVIEDLAEGTEPEI
ncbi:MAG: hypothetical protein BGO26_08485 [Actinobacteria bacterium 69-20]|jgi:ketosteroid isomerase-like protein|nr:nuclear transport factor 2 family protein [Actinomycetota bacterium]OJV30336.1 MAG: hypothetical protein BGO26_08485 [Actinobacteria bacterium 69-20]